MTAVTVIVTVAASLSPAPSAARVGERVGAGEVGVGGVGERAVGVHDHGAVGRPGDHRGRQRVAVGVGVVAEHAGCRHRQRVSSLAV